MIIIENYIETGIATDGETFRGAFDIIFHGLLTEKGRGEYEKHSNREEKP